MQLTVSDIEGFSLTYKNSAEEQTDILQAYEQHAGNFKLVMCYVMLAEKEDEERIHAIITAAIAAHVVPCYPAFAEYRLGDFDPEEDGVSASLSKRKKTTAKKATKKKAGAAAAAGGGGGGGVDDAAGASSEAALIAMIRQRNSGAAAAGSAMASIIAKYSDADNANSSTTTSAKSSVGGGKQPGQKSKKNKNDNNNSSSSAAATLPTDEEFEAIQKSILKKNSRK